MAGQSRQPTFLHLFTGVRAQLRLCVLIDVIEPIRNGALVDGGTQPALECGNINGDPNEDDGLAKGSAWKDR